MCGSNIDTLKRKLAKKNQQGELLVDADVIDLVVAYLQVDYDYDKRNHIRTGKWLSIKKEIIRQGFKNLDAKEYLINLISRLKMMFESDQHTYDLHKNSQFAHKMPVIKDQMDEVTWLPNLIQGLVQYTDRWS